MQKSLDLKPTPNAWVELGYVHASRDEWDQSVNAFEHAYTMKPQSKNLIGRLATALLHAEDTERAREVLRQGLRVHPGEPQLRDLLRRAEQ
jgi:cytochrome c-type biogenesis protein CcmH/NrfG